MGEKRTLPTKCASAPLACITAAGEHTVGGWRSGMRTPEVFSAVRSTWSRHRTVTKYDTPLRSPASENTCVPF